METDVGCGEGDRRLRIMHYTVTRMTQVYA
jgi:hypothetical protein